jgi:hypothetical protein
VQDFIEEIEKFVDVGFHTQLSAVPGGKGNPRPQVLDLEPIFDVDGEEEGGQKIKVPKVR